MLEIAKFNIYTCNYSKDFNNLGIPNSEYNTLQPGLKRFFYIMCL